MAVDLLRSVMSVVDVPLHLLVAQVVGQKAQALPVAVIPE